MLKRASQWIVQRLEDVFGWYGGCVARRPLLAIASCVLVTGLALVGLLRYRTENNAFKLWIPDNSDFVANFAWLVRLCGYLAAVSTISTISTISTVSTGCQHQLLPAPCHGHPSPGLQV